MKVKRQVSSRSAKEIARPVGAANMAAAPRSKPLVFISHHSGDADLGDAFRNLLTGASGGMLDSFLSSDCKGTDGMEFGDEWYRRIMAKIGEATDVVALLTRSSLDRPWILFEAGVGKGKPEQDAKVFGLCIGLPLREATIGPFGQFQNCADDEDSITKLVLQLLRRNPQATPSEDAVRWQVKAFRERIDGILKKRAQPSKRKPEPAEEENTVAKLFEEIKVTLRELPQRIQQFRRRPRLHPMMLEEMLHMSFGPEGRSDPAASWLIFISMFRDDCPWLHELGMDVYRALRAGDLEAARLAMRRMEYMAELTTHGPWMEEMFLDRDLHMFLRHLPDVFERFLMAGGERVSRKRGRKPPTEAPQEP